MKQVIVIGASGFIGQHVVRHLIEGGWQVHGVVRATSDVDELCQAGMQAHACDIEPMEIIRKFGEVDAIVHCAAAYGRETTGISSVVETNVLLPLRWLVAAVTVQVKIFIHLDTCFSLSYPYLRPYTLSKKQMVAWGAEITNSSSTCFANLQLQHPFGPGDRPGKFIPWVIEQCLQSEQPVKLTEGTQKKDFVYVADVAEAVTCLVDHRNTLESGLAEFQCGRGDSVTVRQFVETIHRFAESAAELQFGAISQRANEPEISQADLSALNRLGWSPQTSLEDGLKKTINAAKNRLRFQE